MDSDSLAKTFMGIAGATMFVALIAMLIRPKKRMVPQIIAPTHQGFLCNSVEKLGEDDSGNYTIQLYGTAGLQVIHPSDTLQINTAHYSIKEVYDAQSANVATDKPAATLPAGHTGTLVVTMNSTEYTALENLTNGRLQTNMRYFDTPVEYPVFPS